MHRSRLGWLGLLVLIVAAVAERAHGEGAPAAVTMHVNSVSPREALEEFVKQTGFPVEAWPPQLWEQQRGNSRFPTSISIDVDQKPYWVAMQALCDAAK